MHGEYKPPGGKLVAADVEVAGGRVTRAQVSGGLFLEPDGPRERINAAVTGIPVAAGASVIATRVQAALGSDAVLAGFTAGAVATAVRRALARASGWHDHDWRFIREEPQAPALHMALDEVLSTRERQPLPAAVGTRARPASAARNPQAPRVSLGAEREIR